MNETFAANSLSPGTPLGSPFELVESDDNRLPLRVVGVVGDVRQNELRFLVRAAQMPPKGWLRSLNQVVSADSAFELGQARMQEDIVAAHSRRERLAAGVAGLFAALVLLL